MLEAVLVPVVYRKHQTCGRTKIVMLRSDLAEMIFGDEHKGVKQET